MPTTMLTNGDTELSLANIMNRSYDKEHDVIVVENLVYGPQGSQAPARVERLATGQLMVLYAISGSIIYVGEASPGTSPSDPYWRVFRFDSDSDSGELKFADGNANFDNVFSDYASLTY